MASPTEHLKILIDLLAKNDIERAYERVKLYCAETGRPTRENADALAKAIQHAYLHFAVLPVHIFLRGASEALGAELGESIKGHFEKPLQRTEAWRQILRAMGRERYARELRSLIRGKQLKEAASRVRFMIELTREDENPQSVIGYLGTTLGTLDHDQELVDGLIRGIAKSPEAFGLDSQLVIALDDARKKQFARSAAIALEGREREFTRVATQSIVDLRNRLSTELAVGEPTEEETAEFFEELHAAFRAYFAIGRADGLLDIITLLVELTPRDRRTIGPLVASEERLFLSLNPRQRLVCVRALRRLGEIPRLVGLLNKYARTPTAEPYLIPIIEVMGGLGSREFYEVIVNKYQDSSFADPRFSCIDALGRIQNEAAADLLIKRFGTLLRARPFDPPKRREAEAICTALGRVARSRGVSVERRNEITAQIVALIPPSDTQMGFRAARDLFAFQPQNLDQRLIDWAMERVVQALWSQDQRPEFARAAEGMRAMLGFRQEIVDLGILLGNAGQEAFLRSVEPNASRFSGAFLAVAEILEKIGDERALTVLKKLILTAWMSSEEGGSKYYQETYYDTASATVKPLTRDKIIHALLYTAGRIGGAAGRRYLVETAHQVRSKQLDMPGDETGSFLMQHLMEHGREVAEEQVEDRTGAESAEPAGDNPYAKAHPKEIMDALRGRYLMANAKRTKKVPAIQELARRRHVDALEVLVEQLAEKDSIIRLAAETALQEFSAPGARPATITLLGQILLDRLNKSNGYEREAVRDLIHKINPRREPLRSLIVDAFNTEPEGTPLKGELSAIVRREKLFGAEGAGKEERGDAGAGDMSDFVFSGSTDSDKAEPQVQEKKLSPLEIKRQYFLARKAWVDSGKKGEPPSPPEGI